MDEMRHDDAGERELWRRFVGGARLAAGACPSELELAAYADGLGSEAERTGLEAHLARCPLCQEAIVETRRTAGEAVREVPPLVVARAQALVPARERRTWRLAAGWAAAAAASIALGFAGLRAGAAIRDRGHAEAGVASEVAFDAPAPYRNLLSTPDVLGGLTSEAREDSHE